MAARQIVLDTETTGLNAKLGDRVIEIGCIEMRSRRLTDRHFHTYLNPERDIEEGAAKVHGLTREFLSDKPRFADVAKEFLDYVRGAELIIHNAEFDVEFLDRELGLARAGRARRACRRRDRYAGAGARTASRAGATRSTRCASATRSTMRTAGCTARCSTPSCWPRSIWR